MKNLKINNSEFDPRHLHRFKVWFAWFSPYLNRSSPWEAAAALDSYFTSPFFTVLLLSRTNKSKENRKKFDEMTFSYYPLSVIVVFSFMSSLIFIPNAMHLLFKMFNVILVVRNAFFPLSIFHSASSFSLSFVEILLSYLFIILLLVLLQNFLLLFPFYFASCNGNLVRFFLSI